MLYLEDYLEMIENLPMEMRERLTEMREVDLQVQNSLDSLDERVKVFFKKCLIPAAKQEWREEEFENIKKDYYKTLDDADEKVQLAIHIHDLVDRHLRKLDQELSKFKMELEADNAGITEILEKRSLELDKPIQSMNQRPDSLENSKDSIKPRMSAKERKGMVSGTAPGSTPSDKRSSTEVLSTIAHEAVRESIGPRRPTSAASSPAMKMFASSSGQIGASSNPAIAAAASQAIAATQKIFIQMQQGRRTSSMKASYDLLTKPQPPVAKDITSPYPVPSVSAALDSVPRPPRRQKHSTKAAFAQQQQLPQQVQQPAVVPPIIVQPSPPVQEPIDEYGAEAAIVDDPNEPRYCLCNQVSYGDMVGCDNNDCPIEWFHYGCVGLTQAPKGKWFCPQCIAAMKRRGRR